MLALLGVGPHWFRLQRFACLNVACEALGEVGRANVRADVGGLFLAIALFAFIAAAKAKQNMGCWPRWYLVGSALGRPLSSALR